MAAGVSASRRSFINLIIAVCLVAVSCSDRESPTSPGSSSPMGKAAISGTLLAASDGPGGGAGQPLPGVTVRVASTGQTAQTDAAGNFSLSGLPPGAVSLDFRGAGVQASTTVNASPGVTTKVTVTVKRGRGTVNLTPRSDGIRGTVDSVNVSGKSFVLKNSGGMLTVQTDAGTAFRMRGSPAGFGDLKTGQRVEVEGALAPGGPLNAKKVDIEDEQEEERTPTATPTGTITPPTATRTPRPEGVELEGTVGVVNGTSFTLITRSGSVMIQTDSATLLRKEDGPATFTDIKTGVKVEVEGTRQNDGSVLASRVKVEVEDENEEERTKTPTAAPTATTTATTPQPTRTPTPTKTPEVEGADLEGTVGGVSGTSFTLMTRSGSVMIQTNSTTQFRNDGNPATLNDIKPGIEVELEGATQPDSSVVASRVSIKGS